MSRRILIVEDDRRLSQMLALHFEDQGFEVHSAADCEAGYKIAVQHDIELIMLDQQLPDGEGIELLPQLLAAQPQAHPQAVSRSHVRADNAARGL